MLYQHWHRGNFLLGRLLHGSRILINYLLYHAHRLFRDRSRPCFSKRVESPYSQPMPNVPGRVRQVGWGMPQADQTRKPEHKKKASETTSKRAPPTNRVAIASNIMGNIFAFPRLGMDHWFKRKNQCAIVNWFSYVFFPIYHLSIWLIPFRANSVIT